MKFKSILIITYGRSGSTLLQGLLNSIDGVIIRGENYNFIFGLFQAYLSLKETMKHKLETEPFLPFYGAYLIDEERFFKDAWNLVKNQLYPDIKDIEKVKAIGYKEIRYPLLSKIDLINYLQFQYKLFPQKVCFLFLFRNLDDVSKSGWWIEYDPVEVKKMLRNFEEVVLEYFKDNMDHCFLIRYENIINLDEKLREMYDFLGAPYEEEKVRQILSIPHSYNHRSIKLGG